MTVIRRQTLLGSAYLYIGVALGFITTGIIYPKVLSTGQIGLLRLLISFSAIFAQFSTLGWHLVITRMFPYFRNKENRHNGFFFLVLSIGFIGFIIFLAIFILIKPILIENNIEKSPLFVDYVDYIIFFTLVAAFFSLFEALCRILYYAVTGSFAREILQRIVTLIGIGLFFFGFVNFSQFVFIFFLSRFIPPLYLIGFLMIKREISIKPKFSNLTPDLLKKMANVGLFGMFAGFAYNFILNVDSILVNSLLDIRATGIYSITFFFGTLIIIPTRALRRISGAFIAEAWKDSDYNRIQDIYYKSSINQFFIGLLILILLWINVHNILNFLPPEYEEGKYVILFIGLAKLTEAISGNSGMIMSLSRYYKFNSVLNLLQLLLIVVTNIIFIKIWGLTGAAFATFITFLSVMIIRQLFLYNKYQLRNYSYQHLIIIAVALLVYFMDFFIPQMDYIYIDLPLRSIPVAVLYLALIYFFRISEDFNDLINKIISRHLKR